MLAWHGAEERLSGVEHGWRGRRPMRTFMEPPAETTRRRRGAVAWPDRAVGEVLARAALSSRPRPTAVLALSDTLALSTLSVAHWMGLRVPEDVSIAGVDDLPDSEAIGLTSALVPYRPLGERAGDLLTAVLAGGEPPPTPDLPTALSIRRTTGPPPPAQ